MMSTEVIINGLPLKDILQKNTNLSTELIGALLAFVALEKEMSGIKEQMNFLAMGICIFLSFTIWANLTGTFLYLGLSGSILWSIMLITYFVEFHAKKNAYNAIILNIDELITKFEKIQ